MCHLTQQVSSLNFSDLSAISFTSLQGEIGIPGERGIAGPRGVAVS